MCGCNIVTRAPGITSAQVLSRAIITACHHLQSNIDHSRTTGQRVVSETETEGLYYRCRGDGGWGRRVSAGIARVKDVCVLTGQEVEIDC